MAAKSMFSDEQRTHIRRSYLNQNLPPSAVVLSLNTKFGTTFSLGQVQRYISSNHSAAKTAILRKVETIEVLSVNRIARKIANDKADAMVKFAGRSETLATKAFDMADRATDARTLTAAASAAKSAITMFRVCAGLDGPGSGPRGTSQFNFNFANVQPLMPGQAQPAQGVLEVVVSPAAEDDLDDEDS
jgi:hypothetical protein